MKKRFFPVILLLFGAKFLLPLGTLCAQERPMSYQDRLSAARQSLYAIGKPVEQQSYRQGKTSGTPYLFQEWLPGDVWLESGHVHESVLIKLDLYNDMILYQGEQGLVALDEDFISQFVIYDASKAHRFVKHHLKGASPRFYHSLYEGRCALLKYHDKVLVKSEEVPGNRQNEFQEKDVYFLKVFERPFEEVRLSKSSLLRRFSPEEERVKAYLREMNLDLKAEAELVQLLHFIDGS